MPFWKTAVGAVLVALPIATLGQAKTPYVLGAVLSLSGPVAPNGVPTKEGIEVAVAEINARGGVQGHPLEVLMEDDQSKPDQAVILANKLITQNGVRILLGASFGSTSNAIASVVEKHNMVQLAPTAWTKPDLRVVPYTFYFLADFESVVDRMLAYMSKDLKVKRVGILRLSREYGQLGSESFQKLKGKYGVEVVREERGNDGDTDFTPQLTNIRAAKPDMVVSWFANPAGAISVKNARLLGMKMPIIGPVSMATKPMITVGGAAAEGVVLQSFIAADDPLPRQKHFVDLFQSKTNKLPEVFETIGYDMVNVAALALGKVGGDRPDPAKLREAVESTHYDGAGTILRYSKKVHEPDPSSIVFVKVQKGKFIRAQK
jgi:branched-chain amino acid transport system substrate-binding protein